MLPSATRGGIFLVSLVLCASMMPIEALPAAIVAGRARARLRLGGVRQHPADRARLRQGGYDWGFLAYAVGFGGSMIWFGSSAGVALASQFPEARSVEAWVTAGWHVAVAYVLGFFVLLVRPRLASRSAP